MLYLGQSVTYNDIDEVLPAVYLGQNINKCPIIAIPSRDKEGEVEVIDTILKNMNPVRKEDKTSPSGRSFYYGSLNKRMFGDFKLKVPPKEELLKEFKEIKKHM